MTRLAAGGREDADKWYTDNWYLVSWYDAQLKFIQFSLGIASPLGTRGPRTSTGGFGYTIRSASRSRSRLVLGSTVSDLHKGPMPSLL